jgi:glycerol kinase
MREDKYFLILDQGTSSTRSIIYDQNFKILAKSQLAHQQFYPEDSWVEHDPLEIYHNQLKTIEEALIRASLTAEQITAAGITNQRETIVCWDTSTNQPIYNALVWQDKRTSKMCHEISKNHATIIKQKTGLPVDTYFSASKIAWLKQRALASGLKLENLSFGTIDSWLIYKFSEHQHHFTDHTNASRTMLFNIHNLKWDQELLKIWDLADIKLPEVKACDSDFGFLEFAGVKIPLKAVAGDQSAALFGHGCYQEGDLKNTYGTGCFLMANTGTKPASMCRELLTTIGFSLENQRTYYAYEAALFNAGSALSWLTDRINILEDVAGSSNLAIEAKAKPSLVLVPAFNGLGSPYWDMQAKGILIGIDQATCRADLIRACLDSIAFQVYDVIDIIKAKLNLTDIILKVDGGLSQNSYLMQFQADLLEAKLELALNYEVTSLGIAKLLSMSYCGYDLNKLSHLKEDFKCFEAQQDDLLDKKLTYWHKALKRSLAWIED